MKWAIYALGTLLLVGVLAVSGYLLMPDKASWAEDYSAYSQSLPEGAPIREQLQPMLSDGKLSLWELSKLHCQHETSCAIDSFLSTYTNPAASDMVAETVLVVLKAQDAQREPMVNDE